MKRIKHFSFLMMGIGLVSFANSAFAIASFQTGWYAEGNAGMSKVQNKDYGAFTSTEKKTGFGWNANVGYKFMPYFGADVGYTNYAKSKVKNTLTNTEIAKDKHYSYQVAVKGILPAGLSGAELFAKLGAARLISDTKITNAEEAAALGVARSKTTYTGLYMGVGGSYNFTPSLAANVQWARAKGNSRTGDMDLYSAGLSWIMS